MELVKGRNFSREFGSDSSAVIINETTAQFFGFDDPIGKKMYASSDQNKPASFTIIGVVKNFNFESLRQKVAPLCMVLGKSNWLTSFKLTSANISSLLPQIEQKWKSMAPGMPFSYRFLDESFNNMYTAERRVGKLALIFSVLAILIACLGLLGLVTYSTQQRIKEIGIRKVLGASVRNIVSMLSYDFLRLVIISLLIATPLAWWVMQKWLEDFAYRIGIGVWMFIVAALIAISIAVITVTLQAMRAANANPVKNLRTE
jgi:putative ABC transport system permease protein